MTCELPKCYRERTATARIEHRCCECLKLIEIGEKYISATGIWNGAWESHKTCARCDHLKTLTLRKYPPVHDDEGPIFGELMEYIRESRR